MLVQQDAVFVIIQVTVHTVPPDTIKLRTLMFALPVNMDAMIAFHQLIALFANLGILYQMEIAFQ